MNVLNRNPMHIGKGLAILGAWMGWALALRALMLPLSPSINSDSSASTIVGVIVLIGLYIGAFSVVISATSMILDRWSKK